MGRSILAVLAGLLMGGVVMAAVEWAGYHLYPLPAGIDATDPAQLQVVMQQLPIGAWLFVLVAWFFGAVDGALLAAWLAPSRPWRYALLVVALLALAASANVLLLPHPDWFVAATPVVFIAAWLVGGKIGAMLHDRRRAGISR